MNNEKELVEFIQKFIRNSNTKIGLETSFLYAEEIVKVSNRYKNIDPILLVAIIYHESRFDRLATSPAGAVGLGQIMPFVAHWALEKWDIPYSDSLLYDYKINIKMICWYIEWLTVVPTTTKNNLKLVLACYNGGFKNAYRYSLLGKNNTKLEEQELKLLPNETKQYVHKVIKLYEKLKYDFNKI